MGNQSRIRGLCRAQLCMDDILGADAIVFHTCGAGDVYVFHGNSCEHYTELNVSDATRVSLDFRIGVEGCFDPRWVLRGTLDDHHRREIVL